MFQNNVACFEEILEISSFALEQVKLSHPTGRFLHLLKENNILRLNARLNYFSGWRNCCCFLQRRYLNMVNAKYCKKRQEKSSQTSSQQQRLQRCGALHQKQAARRKRSGVESCVVGLRRVHAPHFICTSLCLGVRLFRCWSSFTLRPDNKGLKKIQTEEKRVLNIILRMVVLRRKDNGAQQGQPKAVVHLTGKM